MSIFFHEPPEPRRPGSDYLWRAYAVLGGASLWILAARYNVLLGPLVGAAGAWLIGALPGMMLRFEVLRILNNVSASNGHQQFIRLAIKVTGSLRHARRHAHLLHHVASRRKHPNASTLRTLQAVMTPLTSENVAAARQLAMRLAEAAARSQQNATTALNAFFREKVTGKTTIVLYGFSTVVCDALATFRELGATVIVLADRQYGDLSHREHERVMRELRKVSPAARVVRFENAQQLLAGKKVTSLHGTAIKVGNVPTIIALGCEAYATDGTVLVAAEGIDGAPGTRALIDLVRQTATSRRKTTLEIVIGAQTYKLQGQLHEADEIVAAPLAVTGKTLTKIIRYLVTGKEKCLPTKTVQLVRVEPRMIRTIVDDTGRHDPSNPRALAEGLRAWTRMLRSARGPDDLGFSGLCDAYILDMNGVLANDEHLHQAAFVELVHEQRGSLTRAEYIRACAGRSDHEGIERLIAAGHLAGDPAALVANKQAKYRRFAVGQAKPYRHATALVRRLLELGKRVYLVTSSSAEDANDFIAKAGLAFAFGTHNTYADVTSATRATIYQQILTTGELDPSTVVVVDDSPANLAIATSLRLHTIGVQTTSQDLRAEQVVRDADDLYNILKDNPTY